MIHILLVEDDPILSRGLSVSLEMESYKVSWADSLGVAFQKHTSETVDLVVLDLGLPDGSGLDFLKSIRESGSKLPVLILTAQTDEDSVVTGLSLGANDYMKKPFGHRELLARIKNILKQPSVMEDKLRYGDLQVLLENRKIVFANKEIDFNRREFDILTHLLQRADKIVTRESILEILDKEGEIFDRTVDSHISHIRAKLRKANVDQFRINSIYGVGYRLEMIV